MENSYKIKKVRVLDLKEIDTKYSFNIFSETSTGRRKERNEDCVNSLIFQGQSNHDKIDIAVLVLADGVGGYSHAQYASNLICQSFLNTIFQSILNNSSFLTINYKDLLLEAVIKANYKLINAAKILRCNMGTTLVGGILINNSAYIVNIGDSRAYLIEPNKTIKQITKDHSYVQTLVDENKITREEARTHRRRNIITKCLGDNFDIKPEFFKVELDNKILLMCSDGLNTMLNDTQILSKIDNNNLANSVYKLINEANNNGGDDNISVILSQQVKYNRPQINPTVDTFNNRMKKEIEDASHKPLDLRGVLLNWDDSSG